MPGSSKLFQLFRRRVLLPGNSLMGCDDSGVVAMAFYFWRGGRGEEQLRKKNNMNSSTYSMNSWSMFIVGILNMKSWHIYRLVIVKSSYWTGYSRFCFGEMSQNPVIHPLPTTMGCHPVPVAVGNEIQAPDPWSPNWNIISLVVTKSDNLVLGQLACQRL